MHATSWKTGQLAEKEIIIHINFSDAFINSWPFVCQPFLSQILYHYCNLGVKFTLVSEWPKQMQRYLYGAGAGAVTHKHSLTEAQIREETAPRLPIIRAEVYGRRELQGISEIKLHRRRTSNTEETSQALERMMGFGWAGNFKKKGDTRAAWKRGMYYTKPISITSSTLGCPQTHCQARLYRITVEAELIQTLQS